MIHPDDPTAKVRFLAAEALRGTGGLLLDKKGQARLPLRLLCAPPLPRLRCACHLRTVFGFDWRMVANSLMGFPRGGRPVTATIILISAPPFNDNWAKCLM